MNPPPSSSPTSGSPPVELQSPPLDRRSLDLRRRIVETLDAGGRGHLGAAFSLVEILRVVYDDVLRFRAEEPEWPGRDRFILSKGHGCLALYVLLAEKGFFPDRELGRFCHFDGLLGGHPEVVVPGVEASTGSLGHGLSIGVGFALAARLRGEDWRTYVVLGDGESQEGSVWEAAMAAAKHRLESLTVLVDANQLQSYGPTREVLDLEPMAEKWRAFGFHTVELDGHDVAALRRALQARPESDRPTALICRTVKGKGIARCELEPTWHHKSRLSADTVRELLEALA
ncbi:MAG: transketolase [Acidobacteriota bacterium]